MFFPVTEPTVSRYWRKLKALTLLTLRLEWSPAQRSSSEACRGFFTPSCIGSLYQSKSHTSRHHDVQLSTWSSAAVPAWLLPSSLWCRITASSLICWSMTDVCTASEEEYICPAGFLYGWPVGVEFAAGLPERPDSQQRHFCKHLNIFLFAVYWCIQRIRGFPTMRL